MIHAIEDDDDLSEDERIHAYQIIRKIPPLLIPSLQYARRKAALTISRESFMVLIDPVH